MNRHGGDVVVGVDGSAASLSAVELAARLSVDRAVGLRIASVARLKAQLAELPWVITTIPPDFEERSRAAARALCDEARRIVDALHRVCVTVDVLAGDPIDELVCLCTRIEADTLVVGHSGLTGPATSLGRVALGVLQHAPCPVLIATEELHTAAMGS